MQPHEPFEEATADTEPTFAHPRAYESSEAASGVAINGGIAEEIFDDIDHEQALWSLVEARADGTLDGDPRKIEVQMYFDSASASASYRNDAEDTFDIDLRGLDLDWEITSREDLDTIAVILRAIPDAYGTDDVWWCVRPAAAGQTFSFIADPRGKPSGDRAEARLFCSLRRFEETEIRSPIHSWEQASALGAVEVTADVSDTSILSFEDFFGSAEDGWRIRGEMHGSEFAFVGWRPLGADVESDGPDDRTRASAR
ncbi:hypothetical protein [Pseudoclavibacter sp. VKM Ac-2888]|uniref:hypothetical protein n=1 Tax=Pseudoclavibacter sp. VKM Ac-2888 TaxID=2783830 RepID=UPI00188D1AC3|nr:hypothetical protein [Pseudoclavibacter sp. VKM Ac-2888]MBF4549330.1 hypothetical protein [Pseudoclavibacter sp. VKM Ac-2888]